MESIKGVVRDQVMVSVWRRMQDLVSQAGIRARDHMADRVRDRVYEQLEEDFNGER